jgi:hypothetical protein
LAKCNEYGGYVSNRETYEKLRKPTKTKEKLRKTEKIQGKHLGKP